MKILVVEDSERLRHSLGEGLKRSGFVVDLAADGPSGLHLAQTNEHDVIVLDIMLPRMNGLEVLHEIRETDHETKVLMLTAKDLIEDRVRGFELGADDYLVKPFAFEELVARLRSLCRRKHDANTPKIKIGDVVVNTSLCEVAVSGNKIALTPSEYTLLEYLVMRRGRVVSKAQLLEWLNDSDSQIVSNVVEVVVSNVRKKLKLAGAPGLVQTKRGFGYFVES